MADCAQTHPTERSRWCTKPHGHKGSHESKNDRSGVPTLEWNDESCPRCGGTGRMWPVMSGYKAES